MDKATTTKINKNIDKFKYKINKSILRIKSWYCCILITHSKPHSRLKSVNDSISNQISYDTVAKMQQNKSLAPVNLLPA